MPDFELVVVGSGADECGVRAAAESRPWMHYAGALRGRDKVAAMACARAYLSPGAVGLGVLDAFALELPPVTTELPFNGHESAYLAPGRNSLIVGDWRSAAAYADAVVRVMTDDALLAHLREGCRAAAETYTVESMSERFAQGVCDALRVGRRRGVVRT